MQAIGRHSQRAPDGAPVHYERHRPEQTPMCRLVQQHAATFIAETEAATGADLPQFVKDEFDAFLESGILAHGFLLLHTVGLELKTGLMQFVDVEGTPVMRTRHVVHLQSKVLSPAAEAFRCFLIERGKVLLVEHDTPLLGRAR